MERRHLFLSLFLVAACGTTDDAPDHESEVSAPPGAVALAQAKLDMAPLTLLDEARPHRARADAEIEKHTLAFDGVPIVNLRFTVQRLPDGTRVALDEVLPPAGLGVHDLAQMTPEQATALAQALHPALPVARVEPAYLGEVGDGPTLRALQRIWRVTLGPGAARDPRVIEIDDQTAAVLEDRSAAAPVVVTGLGSYFPKIAIEASKSPIGPCLRDPNFAFGPWDACAEVDPTVTTNNGVATYFDDPGGSGYLPVVVSGGVVGTGTPPQAKDDWTNMPTEAVDAHVGALRALQFYRERLQRFAIGTNGSLMVLVDPTLHDQSGAEGPWSRLRIGRRDALAPEKAHPDILMHEYTHLVLEAEKFDYDGETRVLHEGIADIFGLVMQPTIESGSTTILAPTAEWLFPSLAGAMAGPQRRFAHPSDEAGSVDAYDEPNPTAYQTLIGTDAHHAAGVVRRWFYFLANGADAFVPGGANLTASAYLPGGMHGIGVDPAIRTLYATMTGAKLKTTMPTVPQFRDAMLSQIWDHEQCSGTYQATRDAWAAVNVGPATDHAAPLVTGTVKQLDTTKVLVTVQASDQGDGLGTAPSAQFSIAGVPLGVVTLVQTGNSNGTFSYTGSLELSIGFFLVHGFGPMSVGLQVHDLCNNQATPWQGTLTLDLTGPTITDFRDETSTYAWATDANGMLRRAPFDLSTRARTFRVMANDPAGLALVALDTPQQHAAWVLHDAVFVADLPIDLSDSAAGAPLTVSVTDHYGNANSRTLPAFVDRTAPSCSLSCSQPTNTDQLSCVVNASDAGSGVFAIRARTVDASPALMTLQGDALLAHDGPVSLVNDGWYWFYADRTQSDGTHSYVRGPGQVLRATLVADPSQLPGSPAHVPFGPYSVQLECRDFWGNESSTTVQHSVSQRPGLTITPGAISDHAYTYTVHATDADGIQRLETLIADAAPGQDFGDNTDGGTVFCGSNGAYPATCDHGGSGTGTARHRIRITVTAYDAVGTSTRTSAVITLPDPPPPPPPTAVIFNEQEPNCFSGWWQNPGGNTVPLSATEIDGHFDEPSNYPCNNDAFLIPYSDNMSLTMDNAAECDIDPGDAYYCATLGAFYSAQGEILTGAEANLDWLPRAPADWSTKPAWVLLIVGPTLGLTGHSYHVQIHRP